MRVELVNTGTELLLGDTINTNAAWIGQRLAALGVQVARQTIVPDGAIIRVAIAEAAQRSDVVLVSGGLGPTNDDLTRESTAELLSLDMELNAGVMEHLSAYFAKRGKPVSEATKRQAMVPRGATVLPNAFGTAPGLYFPAELGAPLGWNAHLFLLPGPPRELKPMVENEVETRLREWLPDGASRRVLYLKVTGVGESDIVEAVEKQLEAIAGLDLGYCIRNGDVDVRLAGPSAAVNAGAAVVRGALGDCIVSEDRRIIEEVIVQLLTDRGEWVSTAESCTGGTIASRITDVSGSSRVFGHGWVTYANEAKQQHLGVSAELIETHGAVSEEVARAMAEGALKKSGADHAISVTGIAGPTGGTPEKPVGTVWIALASKNAETWAQKRFSPGSRDRFKLLTSQAALEMLRRRLMGIALRP
ncbi:competence/damage-inducible protein A [Prosthecobacter sp.]|uniref:competence/damage-inducible protein A n=1 Tax=Prosthecobacter sp. TaxID=1965333 RepID=UPI001D4DFD3B|nr:competence/damage-inducible protein A [Prosthecobacter sp.]MCB1279782.1 competence/damage-inducible protein A [Prosthecobacter sp.]